jgi:7-carboxy-7-deazaguanine synthase
LRVSEIFRSIQGESSLMGMPCTFVRLAGCNLRCSWCDTAYAREADAGREMSVHEVIKEVRARGADLIELTGGEPLMQPDTLTLARIFCDMEARVLLETNGTLDITDVDSRVMIVMDIKPPSSGHADATRWENVDRLQENDEIKVVVADRADYDWAKQELTRRRVLGNKKVTFSPVYGKLEYVKAAEWILQDALPVKLGIQLHKILWGPEARGV